MNNGLTRMVDGEEQRLCWIFQVGKHDPSYEPASNQLGPFDRDRQRRLKRGETFMRLGSGGSPRAYQGFCWRPANTLSASGS